LRARPTHRQWQLDGEDGALPRLALDPELAAQRGDAVGNPHETVALRIRGAHSVVADLEHQRPVVDRCRRARVARACFTTFVSASATMK
jgi:hypothetical protein